MSDTNYWDPTLTPMPPLGDHIGGTPYPFNDIADVSPDAPTEHVGASPYPIGDAGVAPKPTDHKGYDMPMHRATPKPGSWHGAPGLGPDFDNREGPDNGWGS